MLCCTPKVQQALLVLVLLMHRYMKATTTSNWYLKRFETLLAKVKTRRVYGDVDTGNNLLSEFKFDCGSNNVLNGYFYLSLCQRKLSAPLPPIYLLSPVHSSPLTGGLTYSYFEGFPRNYPTYIPTSPMYLRAPSATNVSEKRTMVFA